MLTVKNKHLLLRCITAVMVCFVLNPSQSQSIQRDVTAAAGDFQQHPAFGSLHWTLGETAVETLIQSPLRLSQGFHQVFFLITTDLEEPELPGFSIRLFPNPTADRISLETDHNGPLQVEISNLLGKRLQTQRIIGGTTQAFDMADYPAGTYFLRVWNEDRQLRTFKIVKVTP